MKPLYKLIVFVPKKSEKKVRLALGAAGAGKIGKYDFCAFVSPGTGYFRPLRGSTPYIGTTGKIETVKEVRLEVVCEQQRLPRVLKAMRASHPYEEIAYDVVQLANHKFQISK